MSADELLANRDTVIVELMRERSLLRAGLDIACSEIARLKLEYGLAQEPNADDLALLKKMRIRW
jgi:hypothetical protein